MAVPKFRKSKSKTMMRRRKNDQRSLDNYCICPACGELTLRHRVCMFCGSYKGKTIVQKKAS